VKSRNASSSRAGARRAPQPRSTRSTVRGDRSDGLGSGSGTGRGGVASVVAQLRRIERDAGHGILVLDNGRTLAVSNLDKAYFTREGITKGELMRYYARVSPVLLPLIADRPLTLERYPDGIGGPRFYQHDPGERVPEAVRVESLVDEHGEEERRLVGGELATLLYVVQLGAITLNAWHSRLDSPDNPDWAVLDLDPSPGVPFTRVVQVAQAVHEEVSRRGLVAAAKTSGSRGLHLLVPMADDASYDDSAALAESVAAAVARRHPRLATVQRALRDRPKGTVYVDHMQNARGKTLASLWSVRARPGAPVSAPLSWRQVGPSLDPKRWTVATVPRQLARLAARWRDEFEVAEV
jgi:bifunctional non-homologous end joining protein LigD